MVINTQDTVYSIGGMLINTWDTNYSIGGMVINIPVIELLVSWVLITISQME